MENQLKAITKELTDLHKRYAGISLSFAALERKLSAMEHRMTTLETEFARHVPFLPEETGAPAH
ncbi:hypothetical protein ACJ7K1_06900 [Paenibacillus elgii]